VHNFARIRFLIGDDYPLQITHWTCNYFLIRTFTLCVEHQGSLCISHCFLLLYKVKWIVLSMHVQSLLRAFITVGS
jgi:hypothetical protein